MYGLYIGLGGAGISAVAEFAKRAKDQNLNQGNEFVYIDTDEHVLREYHTTISRDYLSLSNMSPEHVYQQALRTLDDTSAPEGEKRNCEHYLRWYDADNPHMRSCRPLNLGSEVTPMLARAMLFANYEEVKQGIRNKLIYNDKDNNGRRTLRDVYVVSGTCGGTGAGIVIDIFYLMCEIMREEHYRKELPFNLLLVMPEGYLANVSSTSNLNTAYRLNAYALFDEINACLKDARSWYRHGSYDVFYDEPHNPNEGMSWNKHRCCDNDVPPFQFDLFQYGFLFDSVNPMGYPLTRKEISDNVADFLLAAEMGWRGWPSLWEVFENNMIGVKYNSRESAYTKRFVTAGTFVVQTWEELTRKYVHDKFIYQMLRYGFLGSENELSQAQLMSNVNSFKERIQSIFQGFHIDNLIADILSDDRFIGRHGYNELTRIMDHLKDAVAYAGKTPSIEKETIDYGIGGELVNAINHLLREVREVTNTLCSEWAMRYNLHHALQVVKHLDLFYDRSFKDKMAHIMCFEPTRSSLFLKKTEKLRKELHILIKDYIEYLVFRNLSNEDDGYLDHCKQFLQAAIREVENKFYDYRIDGIRAEEWEHYFIKYLYGLMNNPTKAICPNLDSLIENKTMLRGGNEVERDYANLVHQEENGKCPDLGFDASNPFLLNTYKQKSIDAICQRNDEWANRFDITSSFFAKNVMEAFEIFAKEVEPEAVSLSASDSLSKPFSNLVLSQEEMVDLVSRISSISGGINTGYRSGDAPKMDLFVADFSNLPWLQNALNPTAAPGVTTIQSDNAPDRIIKLRIEFGYSFDDYRYFDVYRHYFEDFLKRNRENTYASHHQPFIDKRFLTERRPGESLAEMFEREAQERNS